jgi:hypothetical protein
MKFNRKQLEELTLEKIDEVNDEAGYRKYLEVPEMVEIIASIMEEKMKVFHDSDAKLIQMLRDEVKKLDEENEGLEQIIYDTLRELPVGNVSTHTPESIPERVGHWVRESAEECRLREQWEACADMLYVYADEVKCGTHNQALWETACQDIEKYKKLKNENE